LIPLIYLKKSTVSEGDEFWEALQPKELKKRLQKPGSTLIAYIKNAKTFEKYLFTIKLERGEDVLSFYPIREIGGRLSLYPAYYLFSQQDEMGIVPYPAGTRPEVPNTGFFTADQLFELEHALEKENVAEICRFKWNIPLPLSGETISESQQRTLATGIVSLVGKSFIDTLNYDLMALSSAQVVKALQFIISNSAADCSVNFLNIGMSSFKSAVCKNS